MTAPADDLDYNPFYQALQNEFDREYQEALNKCFTLCIPESMSLEGVQFNKEFVEMHILRPSPFFQGEYMTTDQSNNFTLHLEDTILITGDGFEEKRKIKVLADEIGYNKDNKIYKILLIEQPIHIPGAKNGKPPSTVRKKPMVEPLTPKITFLENKNFLLSLQDSYKMLTYLDEKVHHFNNNYLLLKNYLQDAATRLKSTWSDATQHVDDLCKEPFKEDPRFKDNIAIAVESYVMGKTYEKLYPVVCEGCKSEDEKLLNRLIQLQDVSGEQLSLKPEFCCPLPAAVVEVANLDGLTTPLEKMACMKTTLDSLSEGVNVHLLASPNVEGNDNDPPCLSSDDLIPLLITVIIQSKARHLASNLYFIEHFHWASSSKDDLSFSFVTFKAAISYIQTVDVNQLLPKKSPESPKKNEPAVVDPSPSGSWVEQKSEGGRRKSGSRFDRQMDRITKMLEVSTEELAGASMQAPSVRPQMQRSPNLMMRQGNKPQLGSFLSSLKDDSSHSSWGKQS